jgi:hypothetical protein
VPAIRRAVNVLLVGLICPLSTEVGFARELPPHNISSRLRAFNSLRSLVVYLGVAVVLAPCTAAFVAAASTTENYWFYWRVWFLSEAVAFVMLAPAVMTWIGGARAALAGVPWLKSPSPTCSATRAPPTSG